MARSLPRSLAPTPSPSLPRVVAHSAPSAQCSHPRSSLACPVLPFVESLEPFIRARAQQVGRSARVILRSSLRTIPIRVQCIRSVVGVLPATAPPPSLLRTLLTCSVHYISSVPAVQPGPTAVVRLVSAYPALSLCFPVVKDLLPPPRPARPSPSALTLPASLRTPAGSQAIAARILPAHSPSPVPAHACLSAYTRTPSLAAELPTLPPPPGPPGLPPFLCLPPTGRGCRWCACTIIWLRLCTRFCPQRYWLVARRQSSSLKLRPVSPLPPPALRSVLFEPAGPH